MDMEELLATRLLVQGNSGSGKSHLLRRMLEESARLVQQVVIDPEGDFVSLSEPFGHVVIDGAAHDAAEIERLAGRIRTHRASVVLALDGLDIDAQMRCAARFLNRLFDAPRDEWYPALVVVDEAQMFAPAAAGDVAEDARRMSLMAMTNLMCRGRKRGLAGVIATQRLAKLAKNVAAEASNFLMGRTFLDIDMLRAADLLGMERRQAEQIRDLERGRFLALGPAVCRRPVAVAIGGVQTGSRNASAGLMPLPSAPAQDMEALLYDGLAEDSAAAPPPPAPAQDSAAVLAEIETFSGHRGDPLVAAATDAAGQGDDLFGTPEAPQPDAAERAAAREEQRLAVVAILAEMADDPAMTYQTTAVAYQDFTVRCRMARLGTGGLDLTAFRRRFAMAVAGMADDRDERWRAALDSSRAVPDDLLAPYLLLAHAAVEGAPCPDEGALARAYGTKSPGRIRRLLDYLEKHGLIVLRTDFGGRRSIGLPALGLTTAPENAD